MISNSEDDKLIAFLNKAMLMGLEIKEIEVIYNKLVYYVKQSEELHTIYIPKNINKIYDRRMGLFSKFTSLVNEMSGVVKILGGEGLTDANHMFDMCEAPNVILDLTKFNLSNVVDMSLMFYYAKFNKIIFGDYQLNNLATTYQMFAESNIREIYMGDIKSNTIVNYSFMFYDCKSNLVDISGLKVESDANKRKFKYMFEHSTIDLKVSCPFIKDVYESRLV